MKFLVLLLVMFTISCGNKEERRDEIFKMPVSSEAEDILDGTTEEILSKKYEKADLICSLRVEHGPVFIRDFPDKTVTWDLIDDFKSENKLSMEASNDGAKISVVIDIKKLSVGSFDITALDGHFYKMIHSPFVEMEVNYKYETSYGTAGNFSGEGFVKQLVNEKIISEVFDGSHHPTDDIENTSWRYMECTIDTEIKPQYRDQFIRE